MTQQSSVRFIMEDRYLTDNNALLTSVTAQNAALSAYVDDSLNTFQDNVNSDIANIPGKNYVINGGMDFWQRGTSFAPIGSGSYCADRWQTQATSQPTSRTVQRIALTPGAIPEIEDVQYCLRSTINTVGSGSNTRMRHMIEDAKTLAGQEVTLSWYAKASTSGVFYRVLVTKYFGSGGSPNEVAYDSTFNYTTSWARYTATFTMPTISGKTFDVNSFIMLDFFQLDLTNNALDITGVQLEHGPIATPFSRAGGTLAGELAACQRYYYRIAPGAVNPRYGNGQAYSTTNGSFYVPFSTEMRIAPTALEQSGTAAHYGIVNSAGTGVACSAVPVFQSASKNGASLTAASTYTAAGNGSFIYSNNVASYLGWSAEF